MRVEPSILRKLNERRVLNAIRLGRGVSRTDIQRDVHLTLPTVSRIVDNLIEQGWVRELGPGDVAVGRPPVLLDVDPSYAVAVGIDLGRNHARIVYTNPVAEILHHEVLRIESVGSIEKLADAISLSLTANERIVRNLVGVGVALPMRQKAYHVRNPFHGVGGDPLLQWDDTGLKYMLERKLQLPVWVENDANAAALGEIWFGHGKEVNQIVFVLSDVGVGAGIGVNGSIYQGAQQRAGEFSEMIVDCFAPVCQCGCGKRGSIGILTNTVALQAAIRKERGPDANVELSHIIALAKQGIEPEATIISNTLDYLSVGIVNLFEVIDPNMIVLGGNTLLEDAFMIEEVTRKVREFSGATEVPIRVTMFGPHAVAVGAATAVLRQVYDHTQLIENVT